MTQKTCGRCRWFCKAQYSQWRDKPKFRCAYILCARHGEAVYENTNACDRSFEAIAAPKGDCTIDIYSPPTGGVALDALDHYIGQIVEQLFEQVGVSLVVIPHECPHTE